MICWSSEVILLCLRVSDQSDLRASSHQPFNHHKLDPNVTEALSNSDSDDRVTLAEVLKGKTGGVDSDTRSGSPEGEAASSCPKKPKTTVRKRKASAVAR